MTQVAKDTGASRESLYKLTPEKQGFAIKNLVL
jgi:DNA-binding phage protein